MCLFSSQLFQNEQGELLKKGDIVKFEKLAETLEIIAQKGPDAFYIGDIGKHLVGDIQAAGIWKCHYVNMHKFCVFRIDLDVRSTHYLSQNEWTYFVVCLL